ncbi:hypothetical protein [Fulvimonas yonginensis]|uniref:Uncharacterized protein n=1 Tax=Fulvimonas yonginensis TaxID=1495200 RepID=A0ABU8JBB3_9GAMM
MPLDEETRTLLRAWRARPTPREPWRFRLALGVVLALHVLFAAIVWWEMRPRAVREVVHAQLDGALQVRFIARPRASPLPQPPPAPAPPAHPAQVRERPAPNAMTVRLPEPAAAASAPRMPAQLYDRTGQVRLPAPAASSASAPGYVQRLPQGDTQVMRHDSPVKYRATRFEQYFPPPDETIVGQGVRGVLRTLHTGQHEEVNLGHGVHLKCKTLFGLPTPDCAMPPPAPSKKDGDERLNMAPAAPLAKELAPAQRDPGECIALYRAGKPLPQGCPVDTPARAVDAECAEARRAGKPLAAHCPKPP